MVRLFASLCLVAFLSTRTVNGDEAACSASTRPLVLTDQTGSFKSLNFPGNYPDNVDCQWLLVAQPNEIVKIDFNAFSTERRYDKLWFFDGNSTMSTVIQGIGGAYDTAPTAIVSSQRFLFVWFTSDSNTNSTGFEANYASINPSGFQHACAAVSRPLTLTAYSGVFTSAYYPDPYPFSCECQWLIISQEQGGTVQLDFTFFFTEANSDWVIVYDGNSQSGQLLARLSGLYQPAPTGITTTQQFMFVRFAPDADNSVRGFRAVFTSIPASKAQN